MGLWDIDDDDDDDDDDDGDDDEMCGFVRNASQSVLKETAPNKWHKWENQFRRLKLRLLPAVFRTDNDLGMCQNLRPRQNTKFELDWRMSYTMSTVPPI